jgi:hypothetical protein
VGGIEQMALQESKSTEMEMEAEDSQNSVARTVSGYLSSRKDWHRCRDLAV